MSENLFDLDSAGIVLKPFPHFSMNNVLPIKSINKIFNWFQETDFWQLVETDFYEQCEFSLLHIDLPDDLKFLISETTLNYISDKYTNWFGITALEIVDIVAHKLVNGQHIGIHNDFIDGQETHRMVLHVNPRWLDENGGLLLLFNSPKAEDLSKVIKPLNNTVFGFEISRHSHHAVSRIYNYARHTIVYTFKQI